MAGITWRASTVAGCQMKLVIVEWLDSHASQGWITTAELEQAAGPLYCRTVGWLFRDGKDCKVVVPHIAKHIDGNMLQVRGDIIIPNRAIIKMTTVQTRKKEYIIAL